MGLFSPASRRHAPKVARTFTPAKPDLYLVKWHAPDCECREVCHPHVPSDSDQLSDRDMGILATAAAVATAIVLFAIDPAGTTAAFAGMMGIVS